MTHRSLNLALLLLGKSPLFKQTSTNIISFWLGITFGRVILGFVTPHLSENIAIVLYLILAISMQLLFWLVPSFVVSSIAVALVGFFLGPLFPAAVVATTKLLPQHLHIGAIGFAAAFGGGGACVLPFAVGAIAQHEGVRVLQPIILAMLSLAAALWAFGMPRIGDGESNLVKVFRRFMSSVRSARP